MIRAVGTNMKQNNQENNIICFGRLEGSWNTKRGFWVELYTTVLLAVFSVLVFCWYQICWIFGITVGIVLL